MNPARGARRTGATCLAGDRCRFRVWAPAARRLQLRLIDGDTLLEMAPAGRGYWEVVAAGVGHDSRYRFVLDGDRERPDPASRRQPEGVHGPSAVVDHRRHTWRDNQWQGLDHQDLVIYELHVGTFTPEGTFAAVIPRLPELRETGITALELMPVAAFPGRRNWGYDGVYPYAVQESYGGPEGLKELVDACHREGLAVLLDVVYNHLGPEGNYLRDFGPYFTDRYRTPWGEAVNFDGPESDEVRRFFIDNALTWLEDYHFDGLRLDALHALFDQSAQPFLGELADAVAGCGRLTGRRRWLIGESDLNDVRLVRPPRQGGLGLDGQWNDDFHHSLHTLLTGERQGYYRDFGAVTDLAKAFSRGFVYDGRYSEYRRRSHGSSAARLPGRRLTVFAQNHDQIGNRPAGERLISLAGADAARLAAAAVLFSANVPLLFMGEEHGETAPFPYFVSFGDPQLAEAVRQGRREEFADFEWGSECPDPQAEATFASARLAWRDREQGEHGRMLAYYRELLRLRREHPALGCGAFSEVMAEPLEEAGLLLVSRQAAGHLLMGLFAFGRRTAPLTWTAAGRWEKRLASSAATWGGSGDEPPESLSGGDELSIPPSSFTLYERTG